MKPKHPLSITRLNMDTSWHISWAGASFVLDPWLMGSEIDYSPLFNEQWHTTKPIDIDKIPPYSQVVVTQPFSDHCHEETLQNISWNMLVASPKAAKRLKKTFDSSRIKTLPILGDGWYDLDGVQLALLPPYGLMDSFYGLVIRNKNEVCLYIPHQLRLDTNHMQILSEYTIKLLITSLSTYRLPLVLGGSTNPGIKNIDEFLEYLPIETVVTTHDELKKAKGIVPKLAKTEYPTDTTIQNWLSERYIPINSYETVKI